MTCSSYTTTTRVAFPITNHKRKSARRLPLVALYVDTKRLGPLHNIYFTPNTLTPHSTRAVTSCFWPRKFTMIYRAVALLAACCVGASAFSFEPFSLKNISPLKSMDGEDEKLATYFTGPAEKFAASSLAAATIVAAPVLAGAPAPAQALELSRGAIVVETGAQQPQLVKAEIDGASLLKTLFKNRSELSKSLDTIKMTVKKELANPAFADIKKEVLAIEGDVVPEIKVSPPTDFQQTVRDISKGKLEFIINGEVVNVSVEPSFSETEDEFVIRVTGYKGLKLPSINPGEQQVSRSRLQQQVDFVSNFWNAPLDDSIARYLPAGVQVDNGGAILTTTTVGLTAIYGGSYAYYVSENERAEREAEEKRLAMAEKKKKAAAAKKKKEAAAGGDESKTKASKKEKVDESEEESSKTKAEKSSSEGSDEGEQERKHRIRFWKNKD